MIKLATTKAGVVELAVAPPKDVVQEERTPQSSIQRSPEFTTMRPEVVDAKVYKVKSSFVKIPFLSLLDLL